MCKAARVLGMEKRLEWLEGSVPRGKEQDEIKTSAGTRFCGALRAVVRLGL